jgi:hypothetical protein
MLSDFLEEGLSMLGYCCEEFETERFWSSRRPMSVPAATLEVSACSVAATHLALEVNRPTTITADVAATSSHPLVEIPGGGGYSCYMRDPVGCNIPAGFSARPGTSNSR